jgi:hypothetical protein
MLVDPEAGGPGIVQSKGAIEHLRIIVGKDPSFIWIGALLQTLPEQVPGFQWRRINADDTFMTGRYFILAKENTSAH